MGSEFFKESEFPNFSEAADDIFSILEAFENASDCNNPATMLLEESSRYGEPSFDETFEFQRSSACSPFTAFLESETEPEPMCKRQKLSAAAAATAASASASHITVERNRRKQMNEHLTVLRSLMPCFYVKRVEECSLYPFKIFFERQRLNPRPEHSYIGICAFGCRMRLTGSICIPQGDQASIIGGVVNYIKELQQILQSLEVKKQRKAYADVLSPRPSPLSPRKPPLSPRVSLPISPSTPQPSSPYKPRLHNLQTGFLNSPSLPSPAELSPCNSSTSSINDSVNELVASSRSAVAEVEVKFCGPNLLLKTVSHRIPGQVVKIASALDDLALEILQVNINKLDEKMLSCFTIKIGIECQLSAEELAQQIQQTFC